MIEPLMVWVVLTGMPAMAVPSRVIAPGLRRDARFTLELIEEYAEGLHCLTRDNEAMIDKLAGIFAGRTHIELQRHFIREEEHRNQYLLALAKKKRLPIVATNGVRYATADDKELHDISRREELVAYRQFATVARRLALVAHFLALFATIEELVDPADRFILAPDP